MDSIPLQNPQDQRLKELQRKTKEFEHVMTQLNKNINKIQKLEAEILAMKQQKVCIATDCLIIVGRYTT